MTRGLTQQIIDRIVETYIPIGWKVEWRKPRAKDVKGDVAGLCIWASKKIICVRPKDLWTLVVFMHEVGHALLHRNRITGRALEEYEAERWSIRTLRNQGIAIPRSVLTDAKRNVRASIKADEKHGVKVQPYIRRWAGSTA